MSSVLSKYVAKISRIFTLFYVVVDDRSIGLPINRPMVQSVFPKPSADDFYLKTQKKMVLKIFVLEKKFKSKNGERKIV